RVASPGTPTHRKELSVPATVGIGPREERIPAVAAYGDGSLRPNRTPRLEDGERRVAPDKLSSANRARARGVEDAAKRSVHGDRTQVPFVKREIRGQESFQREQGP